MPISEENSPLFPMPNIFSEEAELASIFFFVNTAVDVFIT